MEIIGLLIEEIIGNIIGLYTRYYFFRIIGRKKSIKFLSGDSNNQLDILSQNFYNLCVGIVVIIFVLFFLIWICDYLIN